MTVFQLKKIVLALGLSAAIQVHAAGLGTMISSSKLGEPLNAEIELLAVTPADLNSIQAALASDQVYQDQLLEKPASYPYIQISVANNSQGRPVLKLTSSRPITEAFLDMLIQVDWPTGRLVKEYTLLLDPPGYHSNAVTATPITPVSPEVSDSATEKAASNSTAVADMPVEATAPAETSMPALQSEPNHRKKVVADPAESHMTVRGDTLYQIAQQVKSEDVTVEQMLVGLYQTNPEAFSQRNMNQLKVGKILRMPDQGTLDKISQQQARALLKAQAAEWQAYKNKLAAGAAQVSPVTEVPAGQQQSGKIGAAAQTAAASAPPKDVLKLSAESAQDKSANTTAPAQTAQDQANAKAEETTRQDNALSEQKSRVSDLQQQVADMKKLLALKNDAMQQAEQSAAEENSAETSSTADTSVAESASKPAPASHTEPEAAPAPVEPATAVITEPEQPAAPSFLHVLYTRLQAVSPVLPWALLVMPVLVLLWFWNRLRGKKRMDSFEEGILTSPHTEMGGQTMFGQTQSATSADTSFLTDFSQSPVGGVIDTHDVDPVAEAEVYMAYGRDAQAEEILKDAMAKDPQRQELKLKLLEIYQNTANVTAFAALAGELRSSLDPQQAEWSKVAEMGQKIDPENPLYQSAQAADSVEAPHIASDDNDEAGYRLNFEAPTIEYEVPENAQPLPMAEMPQDDSASTPETAFNMGGLQTADDPFERAAPVFEIATTAVVDEPVSETALDSEVASPLNANLTPKAIDLPTLDFESAESVAYEHSAAEESLASEDAVFEQIPDLALELGDSTTTVGEVQGGVVEPLAAPAVTVALDASTPFDLPASPQAAEDAPATEGFTHAAPVEEMGLPEITLELGGEQAAAPVVSHSESEEVDTKLDLIQAYIDMEDVIGACELIEEVLKEGGETQRARAQQLLDQLG